MPFTYDLSTDAGKVRLLIADTQTNDQIFADDEIAAFLEIAGTVLSAAAQALETIAVDGAMTLKVIQMLDLKTDGAAFARVLRQQAKEWRDQDEANAGIEIVQMLDSRWAVQDYWWKHYIAENYTL